MTQLYNVICQGNIVFTGTKSQCRTYVNGMPLTRRSRYTTEKRYTPADHLA